MACNKYQVDWN